MVKSWNGPRSCAFDCQDASGILGYFWDFYLLGITTGIQIHSAFFFSLPNSFLNYEIMDNIVASLKVSIVVGQVKEFGPVLEHTPRMLPTFTVSFHLCIRIPVPQLRGILELLSVRN